MMMILRQIIWKAGSSTRPLSRNSGILWSFTRSISATTKSIHANDDENNNQINPSSSSGSIKIGIVGGGIMGITVANSLVETLQKKKTKKKSKKNSKNNKLPNCQIVLMEGDPYGGGGIMEESSSSSSGSPKWKAATARNANTIAVGSSMHVFCNRQMIYSLLSNAIQNVMEESMQLALGQKEDDKKKTKKDDKAAIFSKAPPFFSFQPYYCLGPGAASWNERWAFVTFGLMYGYHALIHGNETTSKKRASTLVQLAKATRHKFVTEIAPEHGGGTWYTKGLLSIHRTQAAAQEAVDECEEFGLPVQQLSWKEALEQEPRLQHLPIDSLQVVLRPLDIAANCEQYMRLILDKCCSSSSKEQQQQEEDVVSGVQYQQGKVTRIEYRSNDKSTSSSSLPKYSITNDEGDSTEFDLVVLAAGAATPLLAQQLGVARFIPTYPLRGFSYTLSATNTTNTNNNNSKWLFQTAMTMDGLYMSSVQPWMARLTGFGELAGFGVGKAAAPSKAPGVLTQYAQALFCDMDQIHNNDNNGNNTTTTTTPVPCFRPMSPDDLPIVGGLGKGLFVHTGHGTLGWTTAFATADCCAQDIVDYLLLGEDEQQQQSSSSTFVLPNGSHLEKRRISPSRFGWWF